MRIYEQSKLSAGAFFNNEMSLRAEATSSSLTLISFGALGPGDRTEPRVPLHCCSVPSGGDFHHAVIVSVPVSIIIAKQNYDIFLTAQLVQETFFYVFLGIALFLSTKKACYMLHFNHLFFKHETERLVSQ